ncbi:aldolase/citrate lyase family protein [Fusobacterium sp.]|uniref:aldolase/citrate lyase family protein n=1 Tax=Fusobacterium sp. TaxID=68766 RepID=UPI0026338421|nr:aldolase/citrate lyase family protein [Fusobacterium sp.]
MFLKLMYITNNLEIALVAEKYGVDRVWVDLETLGKEERQKGMNTVKSNHSIEDIKKIKPFLKKAEMLVRVNPINSESVDEINQVIEAGADLIMLPMWKTPQDVQNFLNIVKKRTKTTLLLETKEAVECLDEVLKNGGFNEIHIGLNDLHLSYKKSFMFELLTNGIVEGICNKIKQYNIPYGFGGIAKIGDGLLVAEKIMTEHFRLGSSRAILSRTFCDNATIQNIDEIDRVFRLNMQKIRDYEKLIEGMSQEKLEKNKIETKLIVDNIVKMIKEKKNNDN